jgi:hypothetical protein
MSKYQEIDTGIEYLATDSVINDKDPNSLASELPFSFDFLIKKHPSSVNNSAFKLTIGNHFTYSVSIQQQFELCLVQLMLIARHVGSLKNLNCQEIANILYDYVYNLEGKDSQELVKEYLKTISEQINKVLKCLNKDDDSSVLSHD